MYTFMFFASYGCCHPCLQILFRHRLIYFNVTQMSCLFSSKATIILRNDRPSVCKKQNRETENFLAAI